jgi:membrane associated rhomboid family serine protease
MVLPIGDAPNPRGVPFVTWLLIAANVAVYVFISLPLTAAHPAPNDPLLAEYLRVMTRALQGRATAADILDQVTSYDLFVFQWGFRPGAASLTDLFMSMFLHAGLLHLTGNMLFLWIYGDNVEYRLGHVGFLVAYLATGVAATLFHAAGAMQSMVPMVGASGAISGVLGFYFIWFPRNVVRLLWLFPPFVMHVFEVRARLVLGIYLLLDNLLPYLMANDDVGVAHGAHIGGFVAGVAAAWLFDRRGLARRPVAFADDVPVSRRASTDLRTRVGEEIAAGRFADAAADYFTVPVGATRGFLEPDQAIALGEWLLDARYPDAALVVARRHLRDHPRGPGLAEGHTIAGEALLALEQPTPAWQHLEAALESNPSPELAHRIRAALADVTARQKRQIGRLRSAG